MNELVIICGATATGKSDLAIYAAEQLNGEIISADSMQIYKYMDIGTAKITKDEMQGIPHYMLDIVEPTQNYSVAEYQERANTIINDIKSRGKTPIIVGGTGLYINSIIYGFSFGQTNANDELRNELKEFVKIHGNLALHDILKEKSPESAKKLHPNDVKRVIRAIELAESADNTNSKEQEIIHPYKAFALNPDREVLYNKINDRVDVMFNLGLVDEVDNLIKNHGLNFEHQSMKAIGYKEFFDYYNNTLSLSDVKELIKKNSRNYAKRQFTWFRKMPNLSWHENKDDAIKAIKELKNG